MFLLWFFGLFTLTGLWVIKCLNQKSCPEDWKSNVNWNEIAYPKLYQSDVNFEKERPIDILCQNFENSYINITGLYFFGCHFENCTLQFDLGDKFDTHLIRCILVNCIPIGLGWPEQILEAFKKSDGEI
jgi:hypothetical protein